MAVVRNPMAIPEAPRSGKMIKIEIRSGVLIQMYESQARAQGLLPDEPETKRRSKAQNKKRTTAGDK